MGEGLPAGSSEAGVCAGPCRAGQERGVQRAPSTGPRSSWNQEHGVTELARAPAQAVKGGEGKRWLGRAPGFLQARSRALRDPPESRGSPYCGGCPQLWDSRSLVKICLL